MMRIGHGYDVHRFASGRRLVLGGVEIPYELGLQGHSDADVLVHAVSDAILGSLGLGDIGHYFPDTDPTYKGISSIRLLEHVIDLTRARGFEIGNIDSTLVAQNPKLAPYISQMVTNLAKSCHVPSSCVNVKATTTEKLGFTGRGEGIAAHAVVIVRKILA